MKVKTDVQVYSDKGVLITNDSKSKFVALTGGIHIIGDIDSPDISKIVGSGLTGRSCSEILTPDTVSIMTIDDLVNKVVPNVDYIERAMDLIAMSISTEQDLMDCQKAIAKRYNDRVATEKYHEYEDRIS